MRTPSANAKSDPGLKSLIAAITKLWRSHHLTYDQARYVAKEVRRALALERPKQRKRVVARLSRDEERRLISHAYRMKGTRGLRHDYDAVKAGITLPWSTGPVEGHINRLKMLKRQMFGRAKLDLLQQRFLLAA